MKDCENVLVSACKEVGIALTVEMLEQFKKYFSLLVEWNEKINLTAITEENEVYFKHFADCVYLVKFLKQGASVCDIGTGAGFPGVVLKIVRPDINLVLVDSLNKRINFLNLVQSELGLQKVECLHFRAEDKAFKEQYLNSFDYVVARAVARLNTLTEYCLPYVKIGGSFLAMKSQKANEELLECSSAFKILGGKFEFLEEYEFVNSKTIFRDQIKINKFEQVKNTLKQSDTKYQNSIINKTKNKEKQEQINSEGQQRAIIAINKVSKTPNKYPRDLNKPRTKPL